MSAGTQSDPGSHGSRPTIVATDVDDARPDRSQNEPGLRSPKVWKRRPLHTHIVAGSPARSQPSQAAVAQGNFQRTPCSASSSNSRGGLPFAGVPTSISPGIETPQAPGLTVLSPEELNIARQLAMAAHSGIQAAAPATPDGNDAEMDAGDGVGSDDAEYNTQVLSILAAAYKALPKGYGGVIRKAALELSKDFKTLDSKTRMIKKNQIELDTYNKHKWPPGAAKFKDPFETDLNGVAVSCVGAKDIRLEGKHGIVMTILIPEGVSYSDARSTIRMSEQAVQKKFDLDITSLQASRLERKVNMKAWLSTITEKHDDSLDEEIPHVPRYKEFTVRRPAVEAEAIMAYKKVYEAAASARVRKDKVEKQLAADLLEVQRSAYTMTPVDHLGKLLGKATIGGKGKGKGKGGAGRSGGPQFVIDHYGLLEKKMKGQLVEQDITDSISMKASKAKAKAQVSSKNDQSPHPAGGAKSSAGKGKKGDKSTLSKGKAKGKEKGKASKTKEGKGKGGKGRGKAHGKIHK